MGVEIERKFLVDPAKLPPGLDSGTNGVMIQQGYLSRDPTVRVRVQESQRGPLGFLTVKGKGTLSRAEFEYEIPAEEARDMFRTLCLHQLEKVRHHVRIDLHTWEVDRFIGKLSGLWLAEIELRYENERFVLPHWVTEEVTEDPRYTNVSLAERGVPK